MNHASLAAFLERDRAALAKGPVAIIVVEDPVEVESTLDHHLKLGFRTLIAFMPDGLELPAALADQVHRIPSTSRGPEALPGLINPLIAAAPAGTWFYYGFNAEYLFYPFSETRNVRELLAFHTEERRDAMLCYAIDLYAPDLSTHPNGVDRGSAMLDRSGYYALARLDPANHYHPKDRQLDFFGGLRWRFDEHIPYNRRKIDRIALFRTRKGLELRANHTFNDEEYNTYACPWHHNLTAAVMSFRVAKALKYNPGSRFDVQNFAWHNSVRFEWSSQQLMDLGLIEPGQWF
ncbi:glycosyltransferase family 2 protein [Sedimentimonas flavescens]|uniref:glycosyltransferase family 2 protein n=1 Tax=Sedimentimonas flavescens TaxID=2851012 RepID=UPI0021A2B901|nr:glycosyltransferase family 2 protein [Sedimentimonas flavescens]MCT2538907.1 glycosyltransferase family 2 protein [Sedimentimonas flavescens]